MLGHDSGWAWFDVPPPDAINREHASGITADLLSAYVRTFRSEAGCQVMRHLRAITVDRVIGPDASDALLRHLEGQRQLVNYIANLAERGVDQIGVFQLTNSKSDKRSMEINDD
jgi:phage terminase large subunit-like protein